MKMTIMKVGLIVMSLNVMATNKMEVVVYPKIRLMEEKILLQMVMEMWITMYAMDQDVCENEDNGDVDDGESLKIERDRGDGNDDVPKVRLLMEMLVV